MSFAFQWVPLWTDRLIYLLLALVTGFAVYAFRKEHLLAPWRQIRRRPLAMSALVLLVFYVAIGLLDSVHFRRQLPATEAGQEVQYDPEVLSLLDVVLGRLKTNVERTYSAPLAAHAFNKETVEGPGGTRQRVFPRLKYGGAHLNDPASERW
ncbi:MAG: ABC transporter permease, partial [Nitrospiria bacterium]